MPEEEPLKRFRGRRPRVNDGLGLVCPRCGFGRPWVCWTRHVKDPANTERVTIRGRECRKCGHQFQSTETVTLP